MPLSAPRRPDTAEGRPAATPPTRPGHLPGTMMVIGSEVSWGGRGGDEHVRMWLWLWPLPPPGPVTVTCSWPGRGLQDASIVLDGDAVRAAATQALLFWASPDA